MRITPLSAAVLLAVLTLSGCNGDDSAPSPRPSGSSAGSGTSAPSDEGSPTEPAVAPADGPLLDGDISSVHAPKGWTLDDYGIPWSTNASDKSTPGRQELQLFEGKWVGSDPLDTLATAAQQKNFDGGKATRGPDVQLDGEVAYHLTGKRSTVPTDEFGLLSHGRWLRLIITSAELTAAEREQLIGSIVASFAWKS